MRPRRSRPSKITSAIDVSAFASIMIVAVFTVLLTGMTETSGCHGVSVDPPKVRGAKSMPGIDREGALVVAISRTGDVFFGNDKVGPYSLSERLVQRLRVGGERKVYLRVDGRALWGCVGVVLDQVRSAGIGDVGFVVEKRGR
ncbi:MAG TPA: biopolymer transporter ExbD [Terriglobales bacterium]|nr:biopolymer transporter ExbD [Terriglobales bacterium]